ncbi:hypothetical protein ACJDU8_07315 [Clostridium sp. WILCCON 0269]|uniref:Uncharacterized protein n=1 Tax=Candidatus Clostridium eludens TaxID=3381663 RepID=A0ABW8SHL0_9CLOT
MITRCRKCVFKDMEGNKYPCNDCSEIMDMKCTKCVKNYFKQMAEYDENIQSKERLKKKLNEILTPTNNEIHEEYKTLENGNVMLTALLNDNKDIVIYQILDTGKKLIKNVATLDKKLLYKWL